MTTERLQKLLAQAGLGSRREIERRIEAGEVSVNGHIAKLGDKAGVDDVIMLAGKAVRFPKQGSTRRVLAYNKPVGEICTNSDPEGRPTVFDKLPKLRQERWINIGRLDINTSGLLLFSTDGELANKLMHPSSNIDREYAVRVNGEVSEEHIKNMREGVELEDGMAKFTDVQFFSGDGKNKWYHVVLMEGRNREVRRLWESQGLTVSRLKRVRYGCIFLPSRIKVGTWEELNQKEVNDLSELAGLEHKSVPKPKPAQNVQKKREQNKQKARQKVGRSKPR